jgi:hypothetical protein
LALFLLFSLLLLHFLLRWFYCIGDGVDMALATELVSVD